jgi:hypothetical protein
MHQEPETEIKTATMNYRKYLFLICILLINWSALSSCLFQKKVLAISGFRRDSVRYENGRQNIDSFNFNKRQFYNIVTISFFEVFDDSVMLYVDNKKIWSGNVYKSSNPFSSTGWSGFDIDCSPKNSTSIAIIKLVKQKVYIQFKIDKEFSIYMVQRYDGIWYIRALKNSIDLK